MSHLRDVLPKVPGPGGPAGARVVGVLEGEGIGPEVVGVALQALVALEACGIACAEVRRGPRNPGFDEASAFCAETFAAGGPVLCGPFGGRFVYDLRRRFDLFCKVSPLRPSPALRGASRLRPEFLADVDILVVRENTGGVYQGRWGETSGPGGRVAEHAFRYSEPEVRRILAVGARLAMSRRRRMAVIVKPGGVPSISRLWCDCAADAARAAGVELACLDVDYAAYKLVQHARDLDVVVAPNMLGDILVDLGAVLLGSRGASFSGNFSPLGAAVYQTNHGAARDLAGSGRANPAGQVLSLAMLLRESLGLDDAAALLEAALEDAWARGFRTFDVMIPGASLVGTAEMGERIAESVRSLAGRRDPVLVR